MFTCAHCHVTFLHSGEIEKDHGDWIIRCQCGAKNILSTALINNVSVPLPRLEVIGYKD